MRANILYLNQLDDLLKISWHYTYFSGCPTYLPKPQSNCRVLITNCFMFRHACYCFNRNLLIKTTRWLRFFFISICFLANIVVFTHILLAHFWISNLFWSTVSSDLLHWRSVLLCSVLMFTTFLRVGRVWDKPVSRARVGQWKPAPKPEAQPWAEWQAFTDPTKLCWQVYHSWLNLWEGFSWPALNNVWKISPTCEDFPDLLSKMFGRFHWPVRIFLSCP